MKAYYVKSEKVKGKFLYVNVNKEEQNKIGIVQRTRVHDHGTEVHLTTDGAFVRYCKKRLEVPSQVILFSTQEKLAHCMLLAGFIL